MYRPHPRPPLFPLHDVLPISMSQYSSATNTIQRVWTAPYSGLRATPADRKSTRLNSSPLPFSRMSAYFLNVPATPETSTLSPPRRSSDLDEPLLVRHEHDPARVDRVVLRASRHASHQVEPGRTETSQHRALGDRPPRPGALVERLVQSVDAHGIVRGRALEPAAPVRGLLGVGVPPRIDDQRPTLGRDLHAEQIVVSMAAVPERAAIEDQEALLRE